nr:putative glycosidase crf2 [Quercus suber]
MKSTFSVSAALVATFALAASAATTCGNGQNCPSSAPCCSQYGQCGVGAYCLGGCDPQNSFDLDSCVAAPVCSGSNFALNGLDDITPNTYYLGDPSKANWVSSGTPAPYNDGSVLLTMAPNTVGTLLTSTHYVWYGKISATLTTSQGAGVVTAFILMSDVKDEIDFEFVGTDLLSAQSNYYFQGITDYDNELNLTTTDTRQNSHTYTFDWTPDSITWSIDGVAIRTKNRKDTYNTTTNQFHYPQTPARVQLSLWPAGLSSNGEGTISWAGGLVDWDSPYMANGYYYAVVSDVTVECYDPPDGFDNNFGSKAYYYTNLYGTNDTVAIGNNNTILSSFYATGDNPTYDPNAKASASASASSPSSTPSADVATVPGISGGGARSDSGSPVSGGTGSSGSSSSAGSGSDSSSVSGSGSTTFTQGEGASGTSQASKVMAGSAVALLGFFVAALML